MGKGWVGAGIGLSISQGGGEEDLKIWWQEVATVIKIGAIVFTNVIFSSISSTTVSI